MRRVVVLAEAAEDLEEARRFYDAREPGVGDYCVTSLLADADLIYYTMGASEKDEEEAIRKAVDFSTTTRRQTVDWSGLPCEARFWDWKLGPAKAHYL